MSLIDAENISKSYGIKSLFRNIDFFVNEGDKIGIIGINGTGKSTLLKIIYGTETPDTGRITRGNSIKIEYLPQNPEFKPDMDVLQQVFAGNSDVMKLIREYYKALQDENISGNEIIKLNEKMDTLNAWNIESEAKTVLTRLGVSDFNAKIDTLSGGQRKRIALASALINPSDLLILDEPTNHLDNETIDWLEQYLNNRKGAVIMVTHDRYFLDRVANGIFELDQGKIYAYKGNYDYFLQKKLEREEIESAVEKKKTNLLRKELSWIKRGARARSTKQKARIERFENLNDQVSENKYDGNNEKVDMSFLGQRLGKKIIEIQNLSKSFDDRKLIDSFNYTVLKNDRIGIIGNNGCGKSTLINMIYGKLNPDEGNIEIGPTVKMGLYSQETQHMDDSLRVIDYIKKGAEYINTSDGLKLSASQMLERFLFPEPAQWDIIAKLSGGERRRLYLLRVLMSSPNVLLLDEPTNDLDIQTLTVLEDYIDNFDGVVIAVSHDRYFLDKIAHKIFAFENGKINQYTGNYSDYKEKYLQNIEMVQTLRDNKEVKNKPAAKNINKENDTKKPKLSFKEQKEYETIDQDIAELESKKSTLESQIEKSSTDYEKLQRLLTEKNEIEKLLDEKMDRWVYLNEIEEKINNK